MERGFQSLLSTGKYAAGDDDFQSLENSDEACVNRDMRVQPWSCEKAKSLYCPYGSSYDILDGGFRSKDIGAGECWKEDSKWRCTERAEKVKRPKNEPSTKPLKFNPTTVFCQLPELRSMEQVNRDDRLLKQCFSPIATTTTPHMLEQSVTNFQLTANNFTPAPLRQIHPTFPPPAKTSNREQALRRRNTLSDKTRSLQKVLPWDKKMDMATVYEETYKYIKFLQAQITVLESMPVASASFSNIGSENPRYVNHYGGLGKLNRQQLLEVVVNSHAAQTILYSKGCSIYSLEQLIFSSISQDTTHEVTSHRNL